MESRVQLHEMASKRAFYMLQACLAMGACLELVTGDGRHLPE